MASTKKDLEIIYNLQWKNNPGHLNDKANIVAMCDIPATTLNWETFKSYLLKNSGAAGDDVKVSYVSIDDKEFPIESQLDFQIALYSFRQRARTGSIITLKLDCVSDTSRNGPIKRLRRMIDKSTVEAEVATVPEEDTPEWFKKYMKEFKKDVIDEVTASVMNAVSNIKQNTCYHARKSKFDCCKRQRKNSFGLNLAEINEKEFIKSLKLERKLDNKLEKLEHKTLKIKEKKMALQTTDANEFQIPINEIKSDIENVGVTVVGDHEVFIPNMVGGETYRHEWEVINSGSVEWTSNTELRYAWSSEALKPINMLVPCPKLKPNEKGTVSISGEIPKQPGTYECYWHFFHENRRLGQWIGCLFTVDPLPFNTPSANMEKPNEIILPPLHFNTSTPKKLKLDSPLESDDSNMANVSDHLQNMAINDVNLFDSCVGSESEPQDLISMDRSISSINSAPSDEFVVLRLPENEDKESDISQEAVTVYIPIDSIKVEKIDCIKVKEEPIEIEDDNNNTNSAAAFFEELSSDEIKESQYAYVNYNGGKFAVPKSFLRPDYLATAEDAPDPSTTNSQQSDPTKTDESSKTGNMTNSSIENKTRLFVFPLNCPGFEVVYPTNFMNESLNLHLNESCESTQTSMTERNNMYPPKHDYNAFPLGFGNISMSSSYTGNGSECIRCNPLSYRPNVYAQPNYTHEFNHSTCGGQYCQQFVNTREKATETNCSTTSTTNVPRYPTNMILTPTTVHENVPSAPRPNQTTMNDANAVPMFPDTIVTGAVNVASSAINTARTVLNMFTSKPEQGRWHNGHWVTTDPNSRREKALRVLYEMGFWDRDLNATLLARYNDDVQRVTSELLQ